jgi:hypothetical protein
VPDKSPYRTSAQKQLFVGIQNWKFRTNRICQVPKNNSLWASKTGNSGRTESVSCDLRGSGVSGQPRQSGGVYPALAQVPRTGFLRNQGHLCGVEVWLGGLGGTYRLPTLSSVGASLFPPCFRFHTPLMESGRRKRPVCPPVSNIRSTSSLLFASVSNRVGVEAVHCAAVARAVRVDLAMVGA